MSIVIYNPNGALVEQFPEFKSLTVYGTTEDPLFLETDITKILEFNDMNVARDYQMDKDYVKIKIFTGGQRREVNALTERGLYCAMFKSKSELAEKFKDFVTIVLKSLRQKGSVTLKEACEKLEMQTRLSQKMFDKNNILLLENEKLKNQKPPTLQNDRSAEYYLFRIKQKLMKPIGVFLEPIPKNLKDEYDYSLEDEPQEDQNMIYSLGTQPAKGHAARVSSVYVMPGTTLKHLYDHFEAKGFVIRGTKLIKISLFELTEEVMDREIDS